MEVIHNQQTIKHTRWKQVERVMGEIEQGEDTGSVRLNPLGLRKAFLIRCHLRRLKETVHVHSPVKGNADQESSKCEGP